MSLATYLIPLLAWLPDSFVHLFAYKRLLLLRSNNIDPCFFLIHHLVLVYVCGYGALRSYHVIFRKCSHLSFSNTIDRKAFGRNSGFNSLGHFCGPCRPLESALQWTFCLMANYLNWRWRLHVNHNRARSKARSVTNHKRTVHLLWSEDIIHRRDNKGLRAQTNKQTNSHPDTQ